MNEIKIRSAELEDSAGIARLITQLGYPTTEEEMRERLTAVFRETIYTTFVAEKEARAVGMIGVGFFRYFEKNGTYGRILTLVVDEQTRGRGVGAALVAEAESWLQKRGAVAVIVASGKQRFDAHRFYLGRGYAETGVRFVKSLS